MASQINNEKIMEEKTITHREPFWMIEKGYFNYFHLQDKLAVVSKPFCQLALDLDLILPDGPEKSVCMRKLLEAKDCAVRAAL